MAIVARGLGGDGTPLVTFGLGLWETTVVIQSVGGSWRTETRRKHPQDTLREIQLAEDEEILAVIVLAVSEGLIP